MTMGIKNKDDKIILMTTTMVIMTTMMIMHMHIAHVNAKDPTHVYGCMYLSGIVVASKEKDKAGRPGFSCKWMIIMMMTVITVVIALTIIITIIIIIVITIITIIIVITTIITIIIVIN